MKNQKEFNECSRRLKALADPNRLRLVKCLFEGESNVSDLCEKLGEEIVKVSHHLGILRHADIVQMEKRGRHIIYSLHPEVLASGRLQSHIDLGCCRLDLE